MNWKQRLYRLTHWEEWHYHVKYIPLLPVWLWYILRARSVWFFTPANPTLTFGGMDGETKEEMYTQLPPGTYPHSVFIDPDMPEDTVKKLWTASGLKFPVAVKPDVGMGGMMFRKLNNMESLLRYHAYIDRRYVIQEMIHYPMEVAVFYYRMPNQDKGTVSGFISKEKPVVIGDGQSTLKQLVQQHKGVRFMEAEMYAKHRDKWTTIIPNGEAYTLLEVSNRTQGGKMISLAHEMDDRLVAVMDSISKYRNTFLYGRYDIKCNSIEAFKSGKEFSILEFNGCGSGVQHIYGNKYSLFQACRMIVHHWNMMFKIARYNHSKGIPYWSFMKGLKFLQHSKRELKHLKMLEAGFQEA